MTYMLFDASGNAQGAFDHHEDAVRALREIVSHDPSATRELAILSMDEHGVAHGEPETAADIGLGSALVAIGVAHMSTAALGIVPIPPLDQHAAPWRTRPGERPEPATALEPLPG